MPRGELAVVDEHDQRKAVDRSSRLAERVRRATRLGVIARRLRSPARPAGTTRGSRKPVGQPQSRRAARSAARGAAGRRRRSPPSSPRSARRPSSRACRSSCASGSAGRAANRRARSRCRKNAGMSWMSSVRVVLAGDDQQVLGQRQLPLAEDRVGLRQQLLRPAALGDTARSARCRSPEQRMHAGRIDGMDRLHAGQHRRDDRPGQLVDELAEASCLPAAAGRRR